MAGTLLDGDYSIANLKNRFFLKVWVLFRHSKNAQNIDNQSVKGRKVSNLNSTCVAQDSSSLSRPFSSPSTLHTVSRGICESCTSTGNAVATDKTICMLIGYRSCLHFHSSHTDGWSTIITHGRFAEVRLLVTLYSGPSRDIKPQSS